MGKNLRKIFVISQWEKALTRKNVLQDNGHKNIRIDWHGHRDRGFSLSNAFAAMEAGANRIHGTGLGIGERCGNTPMDQLLVNLKLFRAPGYGDRDLSALGEYCNLVSELVDMKIPPNYPVVGTDAFRTATGVHAAAIIKAQNDFFQSNIRFSGKSQDLLNDYFRRSDQRKTANTIPKRRKCH